MNPRGWLELGAGGWWWGGGGGRWLTYRYHNTSSVLKGLRWETLESRKTRLLLVMLYKIINDLVDVPAAPYLTPASTWILAGGWSGAWGGGWRLTYNIWHSTDVRAEWPPFSALPGTWLAPFFSTSRTQIFSWLAIWKVPLFFSDISVCAHIFRSEIFLGYFFSRYSMNWLRDLSNYQ